MSRNPAKLSSLVPPGEVTFDINPEQITMSRSVNASGRPTASSNTGTPAGASPSIFRGAMASKITMKDVTFFGPDTKSRCDQLLNWMSPGGGLLGSLGAALFAALTGINLASRLPLVIFQWGPPELGFMYECNVTNVNVVYTRFASSGIPVRATVQIDLQEQPSPLGTLPTNPTSGGLPGRQTHTVTAGESLPGIAMSRYGAPGRWRALAECNGVEDPLRVRAGDRLYLPNPDELIGGTR